MKEVGALATKKLKQSDGDRDEDTQPAASSIRGNFTSICCYCNIISSSVHSCSIIFQTLKSLKA